MSKLYLQNIIKDISYDNLPVKWQRCDFNRFSKDKMLFDFQKDALKNALRGLWLYFKDKKASKKALFDYYRLNGLEENLDYNLNRETKAVKYLLDYPEEYPISNNKISFEHFINRMSFWMATGSGKTLVIVKLIELLGRLITEKELPTGDILFLTHRDYLLDHFKKHVEEFNSFNVSAKIQLKNLREYESVKRENALPFAKNEITVFYYRSDLISDKSTEKIVDFKRYDNNGQWYILLDEAHKGDKEDSKRQILYAILARNGFLFSFSATFTDQKDVATCAYNFNLSRFIEEGYGKHIYIASSDIDAFRNKDDFSPIQKQKIVMKSLLLLTQINKYFEKIRKIDNALYHRPLLLTLVKSVNAQYADLELFFKELEKIAKNQFSEEVINTAKHELVLELSKHTTYEFEELECNIPAEVIAQLNYQDILHYVFNAHTPGNIEVLKIPGNQKELIFRLMTAEKPFALIKIGDIANWLKTKLEGYEINESFNNESYFAKINRDDSDINILMGSQAFYEGWDSNRPNLILFINIGVGSEAKKFVLQAVGRGVRIEPIKNKRKRIDNLLNANEVDSLLLEKIKDYKLTIESLCVFGTNAKNLEKIISTLKAQKQDKNLADAFIINPVQEGRQLLIPVYRESAQMIAEEQDPQKFPINSDDYTTAIHLYNFLGDKIALIKFDCEVNILKKAKDSFTKKERYYDLNETDALNDPEIVLDRIFNYLKIKNKEFKKFKELENEIIHFKHVKVNDSEKYEEIKRKIEIIR